MYNQGFAELSSKYSSLAKNLTNPYNSKVRNQFLQEAQNELKNLSAMDLSQQQNVQTATNVFTPLYGNQNVMGDLAVTAHWDQQEQIAESFRLKDGGKEFSQDNIDFVRMQRNAFSQDRPENVGSYLGSKRSYTPYYDYAKEYKEAMAAYKPNKSKISRPDGRGYMITEEDGSYDAEDVKLYLSSVLSSKAKSQMAIEGVVRYSNNPAVFDTYTKGLGKTEKFLQTRIQEFEGKMMAEKDPAKRQEYQLGLDMLKEKLEEVGGEKVNMQNPDYISRNKENIASNLYYSDKIAELSKGYARKDYTYEIKADDTYLTRLREAGLNQRHRETLADNEKNRSNDRLLKQVDLGLLTFDTRGNIVRVQDQPFTVPTTEMNEGLGYKQFQEQKKSVENAQIDARNNLKKYFYATNPIYEQQGIKITDPKVEAGFDQFITDQTTLLKDNPKSNQLSTKFLQFRSTVEAAQLQLAGFAEKERKANVAFKDDLKGVREEVNKIFGGGSKELNMYDPSTGKYTKVKINADKFIELYLNSPNNYNLGPNTKNGVVDENGLNIVIDGKKMTFLAGTGAEFKQAFKLLSSNNASISNATKRFNQMYDQQYVQNEVMLRPINEKDPVVIAAKNNMQNATLVSADNIVISGYNKGKYMFGFKAGVNKDNLPSEEELAAMGVKRAPGYTDENPKFVVESTLFAPRTGETQYSAREQVINDFFQGMGNATESDREVVYGTPSGMLTVGEGLNPIQIIKTSRYGQSDTYDIKDELTGIMINAGVPLNIDMVIETMRKIETDPTFFSRMRNHKSK